MISLRSDVRAIAFLLVAFPLAGCGPKTALITVYRTPIAQTAESAATMAITATASVGEPMIEQSAAVPSETVKISTPETALSIIPVPIAAGAFHTCLVYADGGARCWGDNHHGQLGNGTTGKKSLLVEVGNVSGGIAAVAGGSSHTCALSKEGRVYCWGLNDVGQLGDGTSTNRFTPGLVKGLDEEMVMIAAGDTFTCALSESGGVKCWGWNTRGQLGDGTFNDRLLPTGVSGLTSGAVAIAAGEEHACAVLAAGGVKCWGVGWEGQLGNGQKQLSNVPVDVTGLSGDVTDIDAGGKYTCAVVGHTKVLCWGQNGLEWSFEDSFTPREIGSFRGKPASIEVGLHFACALSESGGVECWGANNTGQLGDGTNRDSRGRPVEVIGLAGAAAHLAAGNAHACVLLRTGGVQCWGNNFYQQLGDSKTLNSSVPVVLDLSHVHYYYSGIEASAPPAQYPQKYPSIWGLTEGFRDLSAPGVNTYSATVQRDSVWGWDFYQCAIDETRLEGLLADITVTFLINDQPVSEKALLIFRSKYNSWSCQGWATSLSQWENGEYELGIAYAFTNNTSDGKESYAAGKYSQIIQIKVSD